MCGIAGLFAKAPEVQERLGAHLAGMLVALADRGPDSAGVAVYRAPAAGGATKVSLLAERDVPDWGALAAELDGELLADGGDHAVLAVGADPAPWLCGNRPDLVVMSVGERVETFKRAGHASALVEACGLEGMAATHAIGHTRMATESRVTTAHAHPFSTGPDLCLVHNGSLSNHNDLRRRLLGHGIAIHTDNDSEVAAAYLTWRLTEGDDLETALEASLRDLDGFFTFAVATRDGFAVVRDRIACKPALLAETAGWVAVASEHRAIATLPGAEDAELWEPAPGRVYGWSRAAVPA